MRLKTEKLELVLVRFKIWLRMYYPGKRFILAGAIIYNHNLLRSLHKYRQHL